MPPDIRKNMSALISSYLGSVNGGVSVGMITAMTQKKGLCRCDFLLTFMSSMCIPYIYSPPYEAVELPENMSMKAAVRIDFVRGLRRSFGAECSLRPVGRNLVYSHIFLEVFY